MYSNLATINTEGRFYLPFGNASLSVVDLDDVAGVTVAALTEHGHAGKTYHITGGESLTYSQQAKILSQASGKEIVYVAVPRQATLAASKGTWVIGSQRK